MRRGADLDSIHGRGLWRDWTWTTGGGNPRGIRGRNTLAIRSGSPSATQRWRKKERRRDRRRKRRQKAIHERLEASQIRSASAGDSVHEGRQGELTVQVAENRVPDESFIVVAFDQHICRAPAEVAPVEGHLAFAVYDRLRHGAFGRSGDDHDPQRGRGKGGDEYQSGLQDGM